jgi:hybrid cluster-associated redox disulfide protein
MEITKDTLIGDILTIAPDTAPLFISIGMHCLGCAMASGETLEEACDVHGVDVEEFLEDLAEFVKAEKK